jgi:hypothetical protein
MKTKAFLLIIFCAGLTAFAQTSPAAAVTQPAPGVIEGLAGLLNKPAMVKPANAEPLGKNWFRLETDAHIITDQVSVSQVASVLLDLDNQAAIYNGKKSRLTAKVVSRGAAENIVDFVSVSIAGPIQLKTPYRANVRAAEHSNEKIAIEVRQLAEDSAANREIKNLFASRYAQALTIDGKTYTYIRIYTIDEVNASILPGAKGTLEKNSGPVNTETLQLIIAAAKTR